MKISKRSKSDIKRLNEEADRWLKDSRLFEDDTLGLLTQSMPATPKEHRQILGTGARKAISIRIPENDLTELKKIAKANKRKYQQLIVQAIELYIDNYYRMKKMKKF